MLVGGLMFSGFLTLYMVPAIYSYFSSTESKTVEDEIVIKPVSEIPVQFD